MISKVRKKYLNKQAELHEEKKNKKQHDFINKNIKEYQVNNDIELLEFLYQVIKDQSKNNIKMLLSKRFVAVNGNPTTQFNYKLVRKDVVQLSKVPFDKVAENTRKVKNVIEKDLNVLDIIYEDEEFLVINKPSGLLSVESDTEKSITAYKQVLQYASLYDKNARVFQVHRLDKDTSGVLMFTKTKELRDNMSKHWNKLVLERRYAAIVVGKMPKKSDTIISYLEKDQNNLMRDTGNRQTGEKAITHYSVKKEASSFSYLDVLIDSGKKNQIRVALADLGNPIVGDEKYGDYHNPIGRLGLHASCLIIKHPMTGKEYKFVAEVPSSFRKLFN